MWMYLWEKIFSWENFNSVLVCGNRKMESGQTFRNSLSFHFESFLQFLFIRWSKLWKNFFIINKNNLEKMQLLNLIVKTALFGTFFGAFALIASKFVFKRHNNDEPEPEKFFDAYSEEENLEKKIDVIRVSTEIIGDTVVWKQKICIEEKLSLRVFPHLHRFAFSQRIFKDNKKNYLKILNFAIKMHLGIIWKWCNKILIWYIYSNYF